MANATRVFLEVPVESVFPDPDQPRTVSFDERINGESSLENLAQTIREHGILSPLRVIEKEPGRYELEAGERRWRAAKLVGLKTVPVEVVEKDGAKLIRQLVENVQRQALKGVEYATTIRRLRDDFGLSQKEIAEQIGKSEPTITRILSILDPEWVPYMDAVKGSGTILNYLRALSPAAQLLLLNLYNVTQTPYTIEDLVKVRRVEKAAAEKGIRGFVKADNLAGILSGTITEADLPDGSPEHSPYLRSAPPQAMSQPDDVFSFSAEDLDRVIGVNTNATAPTADLGAMADKPFPLSQDLIDVGLEHLAPVGPEKITLEFTPSEARKILHKLKIEKYGTTNADIQAALLEALKAL